MNMICLIANHLLLKLYGFEARRFLKDLKQSQAAQQRKLSSILKQNQSTVYGQKYGFSGITSLDQYQKQVPLTVYEDYLPYIERIGAGEPSVLTSDQVRLFEITSGSVSASKLIPYTAGLKAEFQAGIRPWIWDLYTRYPKIRRGKSYWSITPVASEARRTKAGIPVGFDEDTEYFGGLSRFLMSLIFVSPKGVKQEKDMDVFYYKTAIELLKTKELTLISVWNPSFLFILLDFIKLHRERLLSSLSPKRADEIKKALESGEYCLIWPELTVISCWCDGAAAGSRKQLMDLFPNTVIQPKGLLATEGFMTFPWGEGMEMEGGILSIRSHFFEFRNWKTQEFSAYSQLKQGESYEIILTTGGGLYRYCIRDMVRVTGFYPESGLPVLQFAGKAENVSDLFGEKLNELFLREALTELSPFFDLDRRFYLVAPDTDHYVLYLEFSEGTADDGPEGLRLLEEQLEEILRKNFHYEYCRRLGQLKPLCVCHVFGNPRHDFLQYQVEKGQRLGDIKNVILSAERVSAEVFKLEE